MAPVVQGLHKGLPRREAGGSELEKAMYAQSKHHEETEGGRGLHPRTRHEPRNATSLQELEKANQFKRNQGMEGKQRDCPLGPVARGVRDCTLGAWHLCVAGACCSDGGSQARRKVCVEDKFGLT